MDKSLKKWIIVLIVLLAAIAATAGVLIARERKQVREAEETAARAADPYIREDGVYDLRNADTGDARLLTIAGARSVDLTGQPIEQGVYEAIRKNNPDAEILWDVPLGGGRVPNTAETVRLGSAEETALDKLRYFPNLKTLDLSGAAEYENAARYAAEHPDIKVLYNVPLFGKEYPADTGWLSLKDLDDASLDTDELFKQLAYLPGVKDIDLVGCGISDETKLLLKSERPDIRWYWFVTVGGKQFKSTDTKLDFTEIDFGSFDEFLSALRLFNAPAFVDVATQGFESVQMERAVNEFCDTVFAWTLRIGKYFVRTDVTVLDLGYESGDRSLKNADIKELKYCTQLEALSLNNQNISDLSPLAGLKKLKVLCLGENKIEDLSPLAGLSELQYLNVSENKIADLSPLAGLSELTDLNLTGNRITSLKPLLGLKKLKRVFVANNDLSVDERQEAANVFGTETDLNDSAKANWKKSPSTEVVDEIFTARVMQKLYYAG